MNIEIGSDIGRTYVGFQPPLSPAHAEIINGLNYSDMFVAEHELETTRTGGDGEPYTEVIFGELGGRPNDNICRALYITEHIAGIFRNVFGEEVTISLQSSNGRKLFTNQIPSV
jgi:hypothetical protein